MKPLVKYRGGKSNEIPNIGKHIPRYKGRYIEPFFGGGALYFYLEPKRAIINDINAKLMAFYRGVKNDFPNLRKELEEIEKVYEVNRRKFDSLKRLTPNERVEDKNEELYYQLRDMFNDLSEKKYSDALLYFFINKTAYSGMIRYNSKGEFNVPFGRYERLNTSLVTKKHSDLLINAEIHNTDYKNIFDMAEPDDFMFLDPPYDCIFSDYGNEEYKGGFDNDCHVALAKDFKNLSCKALLVIGRTPLTEKLYGEMIIDEYAKTYSVNIRNRFKSAATHILIANYETNYKTLFAEQNYTLAWQNL
jgi:DNA adenine methylase (dam)